MWHRMHFLDLKGLYVFRTAGLTTAYSHKLLSTFVGIVASMVVIATLMIVIVLVVILVTAVIIKRYGFALIVKLVLSQLFESAV